MIVLLVSPDLMVQTRVAGTLARHGYRVRALERPPDVADVGDAVAVLVDLNTPGWQEAVSAGRQSGRPVLAFGQHVDQERLARARAAGCQTIVARSRFFADMPALVQKLAAAVPPSAS